MKNPRVITWLIAGTLIICVVVAVAQARDSSARRFPRIEFGETTLCRPRTFVLRTALPTMPSKVRVYKVQPIASMNAEFLKLVEALPITRSPEVEAKIERLKHAREPRPLEENEPVTRVIGDWHINLYPGGQYSLDNSKVRNSLSGRDAQAPSAEEVRRAADAFVSRTKLLPEGAQFVKVGECHVEEWGLGDKVVHSRAVVYACSLEEIPRTGGFAVVVGPGSEIVSVTNKTRRTIPEEPMPILSPNEALEKLRSNEGEIYAAPSWNATAYVDSVELRYWESILAMDLSYIMPVYIFGGEAVAPGKKTEHWTAYVEAVRPEFLEKKPVDR